MRLLVRLAAAWMLAAVLPAAAVPCPDRVPDGLQAVPVGKDVVANGLSMTITQVQGKDGVAQVLDRTERLWKEAGYQVKRSSTAGWQVLSAVGERCLATLQLVPRNGSFGYLARSRKAVQVSGLSGMGLALPPGAKLQSTVAGEDDGRRSVVLALNASQSPDSLNNFFMEQLHDKKWTAIRSHKVTDRKRGATMLFLSAQRERRQVEIVIWPERGSQVVMTVADAL